MKKPLLYIVMILLSCCTQQENKTASSTQSLGDISESLITVEQLQGKTAIELRLLRNEIFARKGYVFKDVILNDYFLKKNWYKPNEQKEIILTDIEKQNIELIKKVEKQYAANSTQKTAKSSNCLNKTIKKLKPEFAKSDFDFLGRYRIFSKELKDFLKSIDINDLNTDEDGYVFSKTYYLKRNWDLDHIKDDECEDEIFLRYDDENKWISIQINNCSLYREKGEEDQISEQSIIIQFIIENNCSYKFHKVTVAG
ncbi:YARHG domain-containing protein [Aquimarina sp. 433]